MQRVHTFLLVHDLRDVRLYAIMHSQIIRHHIKNLLDYLPHRVTCIISCYLCFNKLPFYFGFLTDQMSYYSLQQNSGLMSYQVGLGQSLKNMMQSEFQEENDKSIFTNDISLILDRGPMIGYIWSHAPPWYSSNSHLIYCV